MTRDSKRRLAVSLFLACLAALLWGCNTLEGAGRDIEAAGEAVQEAADDD